MDNFQQIIGGAPWWVYLLFVYVVAIGIKSIKPRTISIQRALLFPLIFVAWSLYNLYTHVSLGFPSLIVWWIIFLGLGAYLGIREVKSWHFHKDRQKGTLTIPGNYSTLVLVVLVFVLNFFWGYLYATSANVSYGVYLANTITSSLVTGFFVGRACVFFQRYQKN